MATTHQAQNTQQLTIHGQQMELQYWKNAGNTEIILSPRGPNNEWNANSMAKYLDEWCKTQAFHGTFRVEENEVIGLFAKTPPDQVQQAQDSMTQFLDRSIKKPMGKATSTGAAAGRGRDSPSSENNVG